MYAWWEQQDAVRAWAPLGVPDRQLRYMAAEVQRIHHHPHPTWLTELVGQAIMNCGLNLTAVQQYVAERAPADAQLSPDMVREAYRRETLRHHWGWIWKTIVSI